MAIPIPLLIPEHPIMKSTRENPIGIGLIGCGGMGRSLARRLLRQDDRLTIAALYDPDPEAIQVAREELHGEMSVCENLEALWHLEGISWVMIASWNCHHAEQTVAANLAEPRWAESLYFGQRHR